MAGRLADPLLTLINSSPRELLQRGTAGVTSLAKSAQAAGAMPEAAATTLDDKLAIHAIFSLALDSGFGCWVTDYVETVCSDRTFTSDDPIEAYLLSAECVQAWCESVLSSANHKLRDVLKAPSQFAQLHTDHKWLQAELGRVNSLVPVLKALRREARLGQSSSGQSLGHQRAAKVTGWSGTIAGTAALPENAPCRLVRGLMLPTLLR